MTKHKKYNFVVGVVTVCVVLFIYILFKVQCFGSCNTNVIKPMFAGSLGFAASVLILLFFHGRVFISWVKHVAWWFVILAAVMVMNTDQGGFLPFYDRVQVALFWMAILFVVTVIYAAFMQYRLKNRLKKKEADHTHDW